MPEFLIRPAVTSEDYLNAARLFREYAAELQVDLCFQGFEQELTRLPEMYGPPRGALLLAFWPDSDDPLGCVAVRPLEGDICEMKRLYVRGPQRDKGLGRRLASQIVAAAGALGYRRMRLDTLASMSAAISLYRALDFREIPAYYANPLGQPVYFEREL